MRPADVLRGLSVRLPLFRRNSQHSRKSEGSDRQSAVFYRRLWPPKKGTPQNATPIEDSTIWGAGARDPGNPPSGWPVKHVIFGTTLAYRRGNVSTFFDHQVQSARGSAVCLRKFAYSRGKVTVSLRD